MNSITTNLKRASVEIILLSLLNEKEMYGYEMAQQIKSRTNNEFSILEGSMYPILYRLVDAGYVTSEKRAAGERLTRVYYNITDSGREQLKAMTEHYNHTLELINNILTKESNDE